MEIVNLTFKDEDYKDSLLSYLNSQVFHLTSNKAYENIIKDSIIFHNKDNKFPINVASAQSFGRLRGYVCLFDLRNKSREVIGETLSKYYFLGPAWFKEYYIDRTETKLAYFMIDPKYYGYLIPNDIAKKEWKDTGEYKHYIPQTECWFPGDVPLDYIRQVLLVNAYETAPPEGSFMYMLHMFELKRRGKGRIEEDIG